MAIPADFETRLKYHQKQIGPASNPIIPGITEPVPARIYLLPAYPLLRSTGAPNISQVDVPSLYLNDKVYLSANRSHMRIKEHPHQ
jgi:hypothetical protein